MSKLKEKFIVKASLRRDEKPAFLRRQGKIPAILYGKEVKPIKLALEKKEFIPILRQAGESSLVNLELPDDKESRFILFKEPQLDPLTGEIIHCDLYQIKMGEKLRTEVPLEFIGESPAVKEQGGILVTNKTELEIECLPRNLPPEIEVDLSVLKEIDDQITVGRIKLPEGIEVLDAPEESVVVVAPPREEEAEEAVSEEEGVAAVAVEGEEKAEEAEAEKGEEEKPSEEKEVKEK